MFLARAAATDCDRVSGTSELCGARGKGSRCRRCRLPDLRVRGRRLQRRSTAELALPSIGWAVVRPKLARPRKGGEVITLRVSPFPWMPPPSPPSMSSEQLSGGGDEEKRLEAPLVEMVGDKGSSCESRG